MADFDPPWRLDPLKNIVSVGWGQFRYLKIFFRVIYNFNTPSEMAVRDIPYTPPNTKVDFVYPFTGGLYLKRGTKTPSFDPVTALTVGGLYAWGKGELVTGEGGHVTATVEMGVSLSRDFELKIVMPGSKAAEPGEPATLYDVITTVNYFFNDGTTGGGSALYTKISQAALDELIAGLNGSSESATWTGSYEIIATYTEAGGPRKHTVNRILFLTAKQFKKDSGGTLVEEDMPADTFVGQKDFIESATSDAPISTKTVNVEWDAKAKKITVTT